MTTNFFGIDVNPFATELAKVTKRHSPKRCLFVNAAYIDLIS